MKSIIQSDRNRCYLCGRIGQMDEHHVFNGNPNRKLSEKYGLKVYLCHEPCHLDVVHRNFAVRENIKAEAEKVAMKHYGWSVSDFIRIFGKNYL